MAKDSKVSELTSPAVIPAVLAEFIATLLFVFLGAGTVVLTGQMIGDSMTPARLLTIALAHGLAIALLVTAVGNISGGHINPAVTIGAMLTSNISIVKGIMYIVAQLVGAIVGALLLTVVLPVDGGLGAHSIGSGVSSGAALLTEIILTFALVFVIFAAAMDPKGMSSLAPLAIGLIVAVDHLVGVPLTGASMNPARTFGPALIAGSWADHWIYWVGPVVGGGLAALMYKMIFLQRQE